jgi:hypothetical protein
MKIKLDVKKLILIVFCSLEFLFFPFEASSQEVNPLPLVANWEDGSNNHLTGYTPEWQMDMIEKGHNVLLTFGYIHVLEDWFVDRYLDVYYKNPIERASKYGIPIVIETTQPEATLNIDPWRSLPPEDNPNVVESNGTVQGKVSPCGPIKHWRTVGECWVNPSLLIDVGFTKTMNWWTNPILSQLQNWYPDPPFVIWLSNNEASRVYYGDVDDDYRFQGAYSGDPNYNSWQFRNEIIGGNTKLTNLGEGGYETGHGYIPRYNAMFAGMKSQLDEWSDKVKFVGYYMDPLCFGRWGGWIQYIPEPIPGRFTTVPYIWDGASPSYYVNNWQGNWDFTGYSPQLEAMNLLFQRDYFKDVNPDFWWEISTWFDPEFIAKFQGQGQEVNPERYEGYIKWGMWLTRPRAVRVFQFSTDPREENWQWYKPIVDAIDEIHVNSTLERFWKYSEPVLLTDIPHPWQYNDEFWPELFYNNNERMRWYQLKNNITYTPGLSDDFSSINTKIYNVWIMANVMGTSPEREWLVFAYTPLQAEMNVTAELPGYGDITITAKRGGTYYLVRESGSDEYIETEPGVRAAEFDDIALEKGETHRFNGIYSTAYKCNITNYSWDFDDGTTSDSIVTDHSFSEAGIYEVKLTVTSDSGKVDSDTIMVIVGSGRITPGTFYFSVNSIARENVLFTIYLPEKAEISLHIYDVSGRLVSNPLDGEYSEGVYEEKFAPATKGVYFYKFESSYKEIKGKIIIF